MVRARRIRIWGVSVPTKAYSSWGVESGHYDLGKKASNNDNTVRVLDGYSPSISA